MERNSQGHIVNADGNIDWTHQDVDIQREGSKIILPSDPTEMDYDDAIEAIERKRDEENTVLDVKEDIVAFPLEGAVAFIKAIQLKYGWATPAPTPGFFGPIPPDMLSVEISRGEYIQVPWGQFNVPGIENNIGLTTYRDRSGQLGLRVYGQVKKKEQKVLLELASLTRQVLREASIYKGKAIRIEHTASGTLDMENPPTFLNMSGINPEELILNRDVEAQVNTNIFTPIRETDACRAAGIPLKRGVLLEGRYGVGKTMTTRITAKTCTDNGWTFIMVDRSDALKDALLFAKRYQPAVVFCEDIDRAMEERNEEANDLLNTIDGILGKDTEVMVVLTTNHVERIEQAMLRPGRLDAVISVSPPDAEAVQRLVQLYSRGLLRKGEALDEVGEILAGQIPAVIREAVERSKLAMLANQNSEITAEDLKISAQGMAHHLSLLEQKVEEPSVYEAAGRALGDLMFASVNGLGADGEDELTAADLRVAQQETGQGLKAIFNRQAESNQAIAGMAGALTKMKKQLDHIYDEVV